MSSVINREQLSGPVLQEFERMYAWMRAILRQEHNDDGTLRTGQWTTYTPAWTINNGAAAPVIGNGRLEARYARIGNVVHVTVNLLVGSTSTFGSSSSAWMFSLPFPPKDIRTFGHVGAAYVGQIGVDNICLVLIDLDGRMYVKNDADVVSDVHPQPWSTGDSLSFSLTYEAVPPT